MKTLLIPYMKMTDEDKIKYQYELNKIFYGRNEELDILFTLPNGSVSVTLFEEFQDTTYIGGMYSLGRKIAQSICGVKDSLEPIKEYVDKIKATDSYQRLLKRRDELA